MPSGGHHGNAKGTRDSAMYASSRKTHQCHGVTTLVSCCDSQCGRFQLGTPVATNLVVGHDCVVAAG